MPFALSLTSTEIRLPDCLSYAATLAALALAAAALALAAAVLALATASTVAQPAATCARFHGVRDGKAVRQLQDTARPRCAQRHRVLDECAAQCLEQAGALNCDFFSYGGTYGGVLEAGKICLFNKDDGGCQNQIENSGSGWTTYKITPPPIYTLMNDALSWGDANAACLAAGLQLATVESAAQNALLVTVAAGNTVWIGGTDAASEGTWLWSPSNTLLSYFNWAVREPNGLTHENCLVAYSSGTWNDDGCTKKKKYACQLPIY